MGMYNTIHVIVGTAVAKEDFQFKVGCTPYEVGEKYDELAAYSGGELQHDEVVIGKPIFDFSEHAAAFGNDPDVNLDLQDVLKEHRQEVSELLSSLDIYGKTSIYLVGQVI